MNDSPQRNLPSVSSMLLRPAIRAEIETKCRESVISAIRFVLESARLALRDRTSPESSVDALEVLILKRLTPRRRSPKPVLNATGILLHTGLGRAPLAREAIAAVVEVAAGYCDLELDLETGRRGSRSSAISESIRALTGAESATVVNNNAAATILALRACAQGKEVIVSRGQLVEIGGSFRLPEIFEVSGAKLREVGTTNRTRLADYERAIHPETAALMRVHTSNYRIVGFTESVGIRELAALGRDRGLVTIDDVGSGALDESRPPLNSDEPTVVDGIAAGADIVLFSGDKLLGGPQCGIIAGRSDLISKIAADPLYRAVRVDKMTLAALGATLGLILGSDSAAARIPLWSFMTTPLDVLRTRADTLAKRLRSEAGLTAEAFDSSSFVGGGSLPTQALPSMAVRIGPPWPKGIESEENLARSLRLGELPVVARVQAGYLWIDLRAIETCDDERLAEAVLKAVAILDRPTLS